MKCRLDDLSPLSLSQRGFTLIELVAVVCVVATLMAVSVSYYTKIMRDARQAGFETLSSRFTSVVAMAHVHWITGNKPQYLELDSARLLMNRQGWPIGATAPYIGKDLDACQQLWEALFQNPGNLPGLLLAKSLSRNLRLATGPVVLSEGCVVIIWRCPMGLRMVLLTSPITLIIFQWMVE